MVISMYRTDLPNWILEAMEGTCPYCHSFIADNSDTGVTTARWCVNKQCPGHMMHKADILAKFFKVNGFGPQTALSHIRMKHYETHFDFIPAWFGDKKPLLSLAEIAELACLEGYGATTAAKELNHYANFEEYFEKATVKNPILVAHKDELLKAETYFAIKPPLASRQIKVMATGSFHGYNNREEFFRLINDAYGMYINVIQTGKRKTGVSYLIKEKDAVDHSKSAIAYECHIPIVTPAEFISIIASMCPYIPEE